MKDNQIKKKPWGRIQSHRLDTYLTENNLEKLNELGEKLGKSGNSIVNKAIYELHHKICRA